MLQVRKFEKTYVHVTMALYLMTRLGTAEAVTDDFERLSGRKPRTFDSFIQDHASEFSRK